MLPCASETKSSLNQQRGLGVGDSTQSGRGGEIGVSAQDVQSKSSLDLRSEGPFLSASPWQWTVAQSSDQMVVDADGIRGRGCLALGIDERTGTVPLPDGTAPQEKSPLCAAGESSLKLQSEARAGVPCSIWTLNPVDACLYTQAPSMSGMSHGGQQCERADGRKEAHRQPKSIRFRCLRCRGLE